MTIDQALAFALFALVAAITPGPSNIILASTGAAIGAARGLPSVIGVAIGMGVMIFAVAYGLGNLVLDHPLILTLLKWGGIAFLAWLAWQLARAGGIGESGGGRIFGFWRAAAFQWVNPKSWLVSAGAIGAILHHGEASPLVHAAAAGALFALVALPCCALWLAGGAAFQRLLRTERSACRFNRAMAALLAASIVLILAE